MGTRHLMSRSPLRNSHHFLIISSQIAVGIQAGLLAYHAQFERAGGTLLLGLISILGVWLLRNLIKYSYEIQCLVAMVAWGNVGMLTGWLLDSGGAALREGVCLCACEKSSLGLGLVGFGNWMQIGMMMASIPIMNAHFSRQELTLLKKIFQGLMHVLAMVAGMQSAALLMSFLPVLDGKLNFFLTFSLMSLGMFFGMMMLSRFQQLEIFKIHLFNNKKSYDLAQI